MDERERRRWLCIFSIGAGAVLGWLLASALGLKEEEFIFLILGGLEGALIYDNVNRKRRKEQDRLIQEEEQRRQNELKEQERKKAEQKQNEKKELQFYEYCSENGIVSSDDPSKQKELMIIAKSLGVTEIARSFSNGQRLHAKEIELERVRERDAYLAQKKGINVVGKEKYIKSAQERIVQLKNQLGIMDASVEMGRMQTNTQATKSDWAIAGGIAQGLGGSAAGVMAAHDVQRKNAENERIATQARANGHELMKQAREFSAQIKSELWDLEYEVKKINDKLIDDENQKEIFEKVTINVREYEVLETGNMKLTVESRARYYHLLNKIAIVDGSVRIDILDGDRVVGDAYLVADGIDKLNLYEVGFDKTKTKKLIGWTDGNHLDPTRKYEFRIVPVNVWAIEMR